MQIEYVNYKCGFSLIEISFLISIITIILTLRLERGENNFYHQDIEETVQKLNKIKINVKASLNKKNISNVIKRKYFENQDIIIASINNEEINLTESDVSDAWGNRILIAYSKKRFKEYNINLLCNLDFRNINFLKKNNEYFLKDFADNKCDSTIANIRHNLNVNLNNLEEENLIKFNSNSYLDLILNNSSSFSLYLNLKLDLDEKQVILEIFSGNKVKELLIYENNNICYYILEDINEFKYCFKNKVNIKENISISIRKTPYRVSNIYIKDQYFKEINSSNTLINGRLKIGGSYKNIASFTGRLNHLILDKKDHDKNIIKYLNKLWGIKNKLRILNLITGDINYRDIYLISYGKNQNGAFNFNDKQFFPKKYIFKYEEENIVNYKANSNFNYINYKEIKKYPNGLDNYDDLSIFFNIKK